MAHLLSYKPLVTTSFHLLDTHMSSNDDRCPITWKLIKDIDVTATLSCCKKVFERSMLVLHLQRNQACPMCRARFSDQDISAWFPEIETLPPLQQKSEIENENGMIECFTDDDDEDIVEEEEEDEDDEFTENCDACCVSSRYLKKIPAEMKGFIIHDEEEEEEEEEEEDEEILFDDDFITDDEDEEIVLDDDLITEDEEEEIVLDDDDEEDIMIVDDHIEQSSSGRHRYWTRSRVKK